MKFIFDLSLAFIFLVPSITHAQDLRKLKDITAKSDIVVEGTPFDYHVVLNADSSEAYQYSYFIVDDVFSSKLNENFDTIVVLTITPFTDRGRMMIAQNGHEYSDKYSTDSNIPPLPVKIRQVPRMTGYSYPFPQFQIKNVIFANEISISHKGYPTFKINDIFYIDSPETIKKVRNCYGITFDDLEEFYSFLDKKLKLDIPDNRFYEKRLKENKLKTKAFLKR